MDLSRKNFKKGLNEKIVPERKESRFKNIVPELFSSEGHVIYFSAFDNLLCAEVLIHRLAEPLTKEVLTEVELIRRFNHDNIASFYDLVTSSLDDSTYIVSEILDTHLEHVMYSDQMTFSHATLFAYQIVRGLKYLHSANLCHGSLNPSNILINCHDLLLKISGLQMRDEYLNTELGLCYCSPEKLMKLGSDTTSTDMWSAGCILVEMLLRRKLFRGSSAQDVLLKITEAIYLSEDDWSQVFKIIPNKMLKNHPLKPRQPIRMLFSYWDSMIVSLLESMLAFDAEQRVSAEDALSHSFFSEYHSPEDEPSMNDDVLQLLEQERMLQLRSNNEKLLCCSFSMDDILNVDAMVQNGDRVALNNFRNNLERNSPPSVRTPSPNIMDLLRSSPLPKSMSGQFGRNFRGSPSCMSETMQVFSSALVEKVWNSSLMSISSSSSCNSVNSVSCRPSAKELQHKHISGSDSEKEAAEITDEKLKEDAEINGIVEALRHFRTAVDQSIAPGCNKNLKNAEPDLGLQRSYQVSSFLQNMQHNFCVDKIEEETKMHTYVDVFEEQARWEVEKFLAAHGIQSREPEVRPPLKGSVNDKDDARPSKEENDPKKSEDADGAWISCGRKLLLEQIETEKRERLWSGCYMHKKYLNCKSKEESNDFDEMGCKLTSSEFDELYRLPTEHLKRDGPSWRRYADDMNHSLTNHHHYHFHNEDGSRSSRLSEGGACGGYDYGSLDDLGSSNTFYNSCTKCDPKISSGSRHRSDCSPDEPDGTFKSCPVSRVVCSHKKCFTPKVLSTSSDERHPSPDSPPSSPPFSQSHSGARPKKSRKYFRK